MAIRQFIETFVAQVRADRAANPGVAGDGTALELLIAPSFQTLVQAAIDEISPRGWRILPEYRRPGLGRPDLAFALPHSPARAFIELKEPRRSIQPDDLRGHDLDQFERFRELPLWAQTNCVEMRLYRRDMLVDQTAFLPALVLDPAASEAETAALLAATDVSGFQRILDSLAQAQAPAPEDAPAAASVLAHAARLVRQIVLAQCRAGLDPVSADVRAEFNETLFARAEAGGYDVRDMDQLFAGAFAQTLVFGLLLAREAGGVIEVGEDAYRHLPEATYPLLRGTLRALTLDEVRDMLGVGFDVVLDAVNSIAAETMAVRNGRDPMLYLYEDFLRVFDPSAVAKYGVYYTPPEIVQLMVAETERALIQGLGTDGLLDQNVRLLDPACGTGTFMIGAAERAAERAGLQFGAGMIGPIMSDFAQRMYGFELLVGPYTVAHYRMAREVLNRGGGIPPIPIYLTDTLAPPVDERRINTHLGFLGAPMVHEREAADRVKSDTPILAIIGNPPYKRLKRGEIERLVGRTISERWEDLKAPVRAAGLGLSLNAFPDLCIAFYRWALWRLFEVEGAQGRGVLAFITNRTFLTSAGYGGLRQMLRQRFDTIRIIDLRGNNRGALPATVERDENVFKIEVGVCILVATASGEEREEEAEVFYADVWRAGAFRRREKLTLAEEAASQPDRLAFTRVEGTAMARFKPRGFRERDWPSVNEVFRFRSNGIVTYRDDFVYHDSKDALENRIRNWYNLPEAEAAEAFHNSTMNSADRARRIGLDLDAIEPVSYRPFDRRFLYNKVGFVDRQRGDLMRSWGDTNVAIMCLPGGTGSGPAAWSHGQKPDQHAFRGSYGGWIYPLLDPTSEIGHFVDQRAMAGLAEAYGGAVEPQQVYDAVLALLTATSYTTTFAHDLEDDFPHIPFPARRECFERAAEVGSRIRELQGIRREPGQAFRTARLEGDSAGMALDIPTPANAYRPGLNGLGTLLLVPGGNFQMIDVSERAWQFSVSGYPLLYKWLKARSGEAMHGPEGVALLRGALDVAWRIEELVSLADEADAILREAIALTLTREELNLPVPNPAAVEEEADDAAAE